MNLTESKVVVIKGNELDVTGGFDDGFSAAVETARYIFTVTCSQLTTGNDKCAVRALPQKDTGFTGSYEYPAAVKRGSFTGRGFPIVGQGY